MRKVISDCFRFVNSNEKNPEWVSYPPEAGFRRSKSCPGGRRRVAIEIRIVERQITDHDDAEPQLASGERYEIVGHRSRERSLAQTADQNSNVIGHASLLRPGKPMPLLYGICRSAVHALGFCGRDGVDVNISCDNHEIQ